MNKSISLQSPVDGKWATGDVAGFDGILHTGRRKGRGKGHWHQLAAKDPYIWAADALLDAPGNLT